MSSATSSNTRGIVFIILSMVAFAVADALIKVAGAFLSPAQVLFFLNAGGLIVFIILAILKGETLWDRCVYAPIHILRYVAESVPGGLSG